MNAVSCFTGVAFAMTVVLSMSASTTQTGNHHVIRAREDHDLFSFNALLEDCGPMVIPDSIIHQLRDEDGFFWGVMLMCALSYDSTGLIQSVSVYRLSAGNKSPREAAHDELVRYVQGYLSSLRSHCHVAPEHRCRKNGVLDSTRSQGDRRVSPLGGALYVIVRVESTEECQLFSRCITTRYVEYQVRE